MQAIPLFFGDTIRHLRFTFAAVEDIDQLMPEGFMSVFEREADVRICHLLLWAGFRHESVPYEEVGLYLVQHPDITPLWRAITYALVNDEWLALERKDAEPKTKKTLPELISDLEKIAASDFDLLPTDFYALTPREFNLLQENYGLRDNLRAGLVCATMANIHVRKSPGRAYEPKDFIRCNQPEHRQSVKEQSAVLSGMFGGS